MVQIFITGGTFDKEYDELSGKLFFKETHMNEMLRLGRNTGELQVDTLMMIDSLEMDAQHRNEVLSACSNCKANRILITHGTDTMEDTARFLGERVSDKTIVLTGAMVPYTFGSSDGLFNLGSALASVQTLAPGVCIAMNGHYFTWDNVTKNKALGRFEALR